MANIYAYAYTRALCMRICMCHILPSEYSTGTVGLYFNNEYRALRDVASFFVRYKGCTLLRVELEHACSVTKRQQNDEQKAVSDWKDATYDWGQRRM
jgi:hypothetical protein